MEEVYKMGTLLLEECWHTLLEAKDKMMLINLLSTGTQKQLQQQTFILITNNEGAFKLQ